MLCMAWWACVASLLSSCTPLHLHDGVQHMTGLLQQYVCLGPGSFSHPGRLGKASCRCKAVYRHSLCLVHALKRSVAAVLQRIAVVRSSKAEGELCMRCLRDC
jgi:hypothetical protein